MLPFGLTDRPDKLHPDPDAVIFLLILFVLIKTIRSIVGSLHV